MNRLTSLLSLMLALQLLVSAALFWPRDNPGESDARAALMPLAADRIDRLIISDDDESLLLQRGETGWIMPDYHRLPVQESRLNRVLTDLPGLSRGWPVAGSDSAPQRFEVAADSFQRKVAFFSGEDARGEIFVGTSPGFRKVHVRPAGDDRVYAVEFNTFELPVTPGEWLDKSLLKLDQIEAVTGLDYAIRRQGDGWSGDDGRAPDPEQVDTLLNGLSGLRVSGVADIATASVLADTAAPPTLSVSAAGKDYDFRLYEIEDDYFVQRSDIPVFFSLSAFDYDRLNDVDADSLYAEAEDDGAANEEPDSDDNTGDTD